jgi:magnesium chelatase family protein
MGNRRRTLLAKVASCAVLGLEGAIVEVEVDISPGLPVFKRNTMPSPAKPDE